MTTPEATAADHQATPFVKHLDVFTTNMEAAGVTEKHAGSTRAYVERLAADVGLGRLGDLHRERLECWLVARDREGMSARSRNAYRDALVTFCNWCVSTGRLAVNPFDMIPKANEKADPRRRRRSMTEAELVKLLAVATNVRYLTR